MSKYFEFEALWRKLTRLGERLDELWLGEVVDAASWLVYYMHQSVRGHPFMMSTKILDFCFDLPCPHEPDPPPLWTLTCGRHEIHIALLKRLVHWPSGPKAEIRLYHCNWFKTVLLIIFIINLCRRKFPHLFRERLNSGKKKPISLREKKTGWYRLFSWFGLERLS